MFVNGLMTTSPAAGTRDAKSTATDDPSDQPEITIPRGGMCKSRVKYAYAADAVSKHPRSLGAPAFIPYPGYSGMNTLIPAFRNGSKSAMLSKRFDPFP